MKVLLLSDLNSTHTIKWAKSLSLKGVQVSLFGLTSYEGDVQAEYYNIKVFTTRISKHDINTQKRDFYKLLKYPATLLQLKKAINEIKPDVIHAHYATSYGLLAAFCGFHPYLLSVWGNDIFDFPRVSFIHRWMIKFNLKCADKILSTSHIMAQETNKYTNKPVEVTPFGIDLNVFMPKYVPSLFKQSDIVVGTIKTLDEKYGIEYLIRAFHRVKNDYPELPLKLLIVGGGPLENHLKTVIEDLRLNDCTVLTGLISHKEVPNYHNMLSVSVSVSVSNSESFGVAILEACACEKPVVVSDVGGLPEVVEDGVTGIVVPPRDVSATADAIELLILDEELRKRMGRAGRERVKRLYDWNDNVSQMMGIYDRFISK